MNEQVNQKTATYNAIINALHNAGIDFEDGMEAKPFLNEKIRAEVRAELFNEFRAGNISHKEEFASKINNDSELKKYVGGLISNWCRKDTRLNGGEKYRFVSTGAHAGRGDESVREMKKLLKITTDEEAKAEIQAALDERLAEIQAEKQKDIQVNASVLPEHLKRFVK